MDISGKFCPVCKNKNDIDAINCRHCGASLENMLSDGAPITRHTDIQSQGGDGAGELAVGEAMIPTHGIAIYIEGVANPVFSYANDEFVIGRKVADTAGAIFDLSPLGGYHLGVSRRHAIVRRVDHGYELIDLGSSNGTWLNDERLVPHRPYPLASGSQVRLARMRVYVLYRSPVETKKNR